MKDERTDKFTLNLVIDGDKARENFQRHLEKVRAEYFPMLLPNGTKAYLATREEVIAVFKKYADHVFPELTGNRFYQVPPERQEVQMEFLKVSEGIHHEYIIIKDENGQGIGWHLGEYQHPASYYMRNTGIAPNWQGRGIYSSFLYQFLNYIKELKYERVLSHHWGTNARVIIPKLRANFFIAGTEFHESYGTLVKMVHHTQIDRREFFKKLY